MDDFIRESEMNFINRNAFYIEKSTLYLGMNNIRSVEFIRVKDDSLMLIEAKKSFPNPDTSGEEFESEINEICEKFIHSLNLYSSVKVGVYNEIFNDDFVPPEKVTIEFVLVIKSHKMIWCKKVRNALIVALPTYLKKIWKPEVYVINHEIAVNEQIAVAD